MVDYTDFDEAAVSSVTSMALEPDDRSKRLLACLEAFFWSLRDAGLTVDMVEVVRFSDAEGDREGDRYTGYNGWASWADQPTPGLGWETHVATL